LITEQKLLFCEQWLGSLPVLKGVPVARAMTYDLLQLLHSVTARGYEKRKGERDDHQD
jgi:hypothetical protein